MQTETIILPNRKERRRRDFSKHGRHLNNNASRDARGRFLHPVYGTPMSAKEHGKMLRAIAKEQADDQKKKIKVHPGGVK